MCVRETLAALKVGDVVEVKTYSEDWLGIVTENRGLMLRVESLDHSVFAAFSHHQIEDVTVIEKAPQKMVEWRDGQPTCAGFYITGCTKELAVGSTVHEGVNGLIFCSKKCARAKAKAVQA